MLLGKYINTTLNLSPRNTSVKSEHYVLNNALIGIKLYYIKNRVHKIDNVVHYIVMIVHYKRIHLKPYLLSY